MAIEDIALATSFPNMTVIVPADEPTTQALTRAMFEHNGPVYLQTGCPKVPMVYNDDSPAESRGQGQFEIGKANTLHEGNDLTIIACGIMVAAALEAAHTLQEEGIQSR